MKTLMMMGICHVNEHLLLPHYFVFSQWTCRNFSKKNLFHCAYTQQQQSLIKNLMLKKFNLGYSRIASSFTSTTALTRRRSLTLSRSVEGLKMILLLVFCAMRVYSIHRIRNPLKYLLLPVLKLLRNAIHWGLTQYTRTHTTPFLYDGDQIITMRSYCKRMYCQLLSFWHAFTIILLFLYCTEFAMLLHSKNHLFFSKFTCRLIAYLSNDEIFIMHVLRCIQKKLNRCILIFCWN